MRIIKGIKYFLICFVVIIIEMTLGKYLAISGTVPMLSFCLCLTIAAKESKPEYILYIGIIIGVFLDLLIGHGFGIYTVTITLCVWVTYLLRDNIFSSLFLFLSIATFVLTIFASVVYYIFHILDVGISFGKMLTRIALPSATYNIFISAFLYLILSKTIYKRR